jgi:hypothetical protein
MRIADDFAAIAARLAEISKHASVVSHGTVIPLTYGVSPVAIDPADIVWITYVSNNRTPPPDLPGGRSLILDLSDA